MIARLPNIMHKSIGIMDRIMNIAEYSDVYIIDDLFEGRGAIWSKSVPWHIQQSGIRLHAYRIQPFVFPAQYKISIGRWLSLRASDNKLHRLNLSNTLPISGQTPWHSFGNRKNRFLLTGHKSNFHIREYPEFYRN